MFYGQSKIVSVLVCLLASAPVYSFFDFIGYVKDPAFAIAAGKVTINIAKHIYETSQSKASPKQYATKKLTFPFKKGNDSGIDAVTFCIKDLGLDLGKKLATVLQVDVQMLGNKDNKRIIITTNDFNTAVFEQHGPNSFSIQNTIITEETDAGLCAMLQDFLAPKEEREYWDFHFVQTILYKPKPAKKLIFPFKKDNDSKVSPVAFCIKDLGLDFGHNTATVRAVSIEPTGAKKTGIITTTDDTQGHIISFEQRDDDTIVIKQSGKTVTKENNPELFTTLQGFLDLKPDEPDNPAWDFDVFRTRIMPSTTAHFYAVYAATLK